MSDLTENIAKAREHGYDDQQIIGFLSQKTDLAPKIKKAQDSGYEPGAIVDYLKAAAPSHRYTPAEVKAHFANFAPAGNPPDVSNPFEGYQSLPLDEQVAGAIKHLGSAIAAPITGIPAAGKEVYDWLKSGLKPPFLSNYEALKAGAPGARGPGEIGDNPLDQAVGNTEAALATSKGTPPPATMRNRIMDRMAPPDLAPPPESPPTPPSKPLSVPNIHPVAKFLIRRVPGGKFITDVADLLKSQQTPGTSDPMMDKARSLLMKSQTPFTPAEESMTRDILAGVEREPAAQMKPTTAPTLAPPGKVPFTELETGASHQKINQSIHNALEQMGVEREPRKTMIQEMMDKKFGAGKTLAFTEKGLKGRTPLTSAEKFDLLREIHKMDAPK